MGIEAGGIILELKDKKATYEYYKYDADHVDLWYSSDKNWQSPGTNAIQIKIIDNQLRILDPKTKTEVVLSERLLEPLRVALKLLDENKPSKTKVKKAVHVKY